MHPPVARVEALEAAGWSGEVRVLPDSASTAAAAVHTAAEVAG